MLVDVFGAIVYLWAIWAPLPRKHGSLRHESWNLGFFQDGFRGQIVLDVGTISSSSLEEATVTRLILLSPFSFGVFRLSGFGFRLSVQVQVRDQGVWELFA